MTITKILASVVCWALLLIASSATNAQTTDPTTGLPLSSTSNVLNLGGGLPWSNTVQGSAQGYSGGWTPAYNPSTGNIIFGYSTQTVSQTAAINTALANAGTGIQLAGYSYSWGINNEKSISNGNRGTVTGNVSLLGANGQTLESFNYDYSNVNTASGIFQQFSGTQFFNNRYATEEASGLRVSFTGKDQNWWAGYYGPRVHVNSVDLLYTTNPCATNPAYAPSCPGFKDVVQTSNLAPVPDAWGQSMVQAYAINTALQSAGVGAMVHGVTYGFNYYVGGDQCTSSFLFWCTGSSPSNLNVTFSLTAAGGQTMYSKGFSYSGQQSGSVDQKYLFQSSVNQTLMGSAILSSSGWGDSQVGNFRSTLIYTPDPCVSNPLYSTSCTGYQAAMNKFLASLQPAATSTTTTTAATTTSDSSTAAAATTPIAVAAAAPPPAAAAPTTDTSSQSSSQQQQQAAAGPAASAPVTSAAPSATNPQPKPGDVQVAGSTKPSSDSKGGSGPSALAMSVVSKEQAKVTATSAAVVAQANDAAATATSAALTVAEAVAGTAQSASITAATATTSSTSSTSTKTASSSSTSVIALQANTPATLASINNQRATSSQTAAAETSTNTQSAESSLPIRNNNATSTQSTEVAVQQTVAQTLPTAPKQQESVASSTQQTQTSSLPPPAPRQQEAVQAVVQQTQTANALPTAPKQQDTTQGAVQQVQTASLPTAPKQQEVVQAVIQQTAVFTAAPTPPKQTQAEVPTQVITVAMVQQQTFQAAPAQPPVVQYIPPPQPENKESSALVDYSILVPTNLDALKKTTVATFTEVEVPRVETARATSRGTINDYINPQAFMALQGAEPTQDGMVKRNVEPNEVAGAVDIASIATQPKGFDVYTKITLLDAQFYKSEEVYKNQKTVDNERVLRGLVRGSDRLHQEMVDLQYKQGDSK